MNVHVISSLDQPHKTQCYEQSYVSIYNSLKFNISYILNIHNAQNVFFKPNLPCSPLHISPSCIYNTARLAQTVGTALAVEYLPPSPVLWDQKSCDSHVTTVGRCDVT